MLLWYTQWVFNSTLSLYCSLWAAVKPCYCWQAFLQMSEVMAVVRALLYAALLTAGMYGWRACPLPSYMLHF